MRMLLFLALLGTIGCAATTMDPNPGSQVVLSSDDDLTGGYVYDHTIMHVGQGDWAETTVRDTLALDQRGDSLRFYFALVQTNYHICEMEGVAMRTPEGFAAASEPVTFGGETSTCRLEIQVTTDSIRLVDANNACRQYYCGARASIDDATFARHP